MSLTRRAKRVIAAATRADGDALFEERAATLMRIRSSGAEFDVADDGMNYRVLLDWTYAPSDGILLAECPCDPSGKRVQCRHLWCAMRQLETEAPTLPGSAGPLKIPGRGSLEIIPGRAMARTTEEVPSKELGKSRSDLGLRPAGSPVDLAWRDALAGLRRKRMLGTRPNPDHEAVLLPTRPRVTSLAFLLDCEQSRDASELVLRFVRSTDHATPVELSDDLLDELPDPRERSLLEAFLALRSQLPGPTTGSLGVIIPRPFFDPWVARVCETGRFFLRRDSDGAAGESPALAWDADPWSFGIEVRADGAREGWRLDGILSRKSERVDIHGPDLVLPGLVVFEDRVAPLSDTDPDWIGMLRSRPELFVPQSEEIALVETLLSIPDAPPITLPKPLRWRESEGEPLPRASVFLPEKNLWWDPVRICLRFRYGTQSVFPGDPPTPVVDSKRRRILRRDLHREQELVREFSALLEEAPTVSEIEVAQDDLGTTLRVLVDHGWYVEAQGSRLRLPTGIDLKVTSSRDWLELSGSADFDGVPTTLPALLAAITRGERMVRLFDGSCGMIPEDWIARYLPMAEVGQIEQMPTTFDDEPVRPPTTIRFVPAQAALLDALIDSSVENDGASIQVDERFEFLRHRLRAYETAAGIDPPETFRGELRPYQKDGLAWMVLLEGLGFGGCLADDMGLGKTVQILALLERRRTRPLSSGEARLPSLIVVPRSLVFNWIAEAKRFVPEATWIDYSGPNRAIHWDSLDRYDIVVTTYGVVRNEAEQLAEIEFDYAILDEATAIKNSGSQTARAVRKLDARHRLALTGTPVENHVGELWSLFEFLNPGSTSSRTGRLQERYRDRVLTREQSEILGRALRPFIFRRTKEQVLHELPPKTEQTLFCDLDPRQKQLYEELEEYYQQSILERIDKDGLEETRMHILEALLRLRQAACHPGLIDQRWIDSPSSKLDLLLEQIGTVVDSGHKALVFSQFTSFLAIVRRQLDASGTPYEYLDGSTQNRQRCVERFQQDPNCPVFLISLKAGGTGLNLTAADYVFLLDPWWNPAIEAQAIDRAHRLGQERPVFAYRLICRGTVEEKVTRVQEDKRDLAEAIVGAPTQGTPKMSLQELRGLLVGGSK